MANLYKALRTRIQDLMLGNVGYSGRAFSVGRFKTCPQDKTVETVPENDCERAFRINFTGSEELEAWNSLCDYSLEKAQFEIKVAYQYTKGGMFPDGYEGYEATQGNGDIDALNDRAMTDAVEIVKILSYHENFGIIQVSPVVDVFSFHPLNDNSLDIFKDRAILTVKMEAYYRISTSSSYSGV